MAQQCEGRWNAEISNAVRSNMEDFSASLAPHWHVSSNNCTTTSQAVL